MSQALIKIKNLFVYIFSLIVIFLIKRRKPKYKPNSILLLRLDAIGDYVLFRNYIEVIKKSSLYKDFTITLCGNVVWKNLAEELDKEWVSEFIWVNRKKFYSNIFYKYKILKKVRSIGYDIAVDTAYSREILYGDIIMAAVNANEKAGSEGAKDKHVVWKRKFFSGGIYNIIIPSPGSMFEFCRNRQFIENLIKEPVLLKAPVIENNRISMDLPASPYVVLFTGANSKSRQWELNNFLEVVEYIIKRYNFKIFLANGNNEKHHADAFRSLPPASFYNYAGKTNLLQLSKLISGAELLVSNETSAVHFAAASGVPFVCISNGDKLTRFHPYPADVFDKYYYAYPEEIKKVLNDPAAAAQYEYSSPFNINSVKPEDVKAGIDELMKKIIQ